MEGTRRDFAFSLSRGSGNWGNLALTASEFRFSSRGPTARDSLVGGKHRQEFLLHDEHRRAQLVQIELSAPTEQVVSLVPKLERPYRRMADLGQRRARRSRVQQQGK